MKYPDEPPQEEKPRRGLRGALGSVLRFVADAVIEKLQQRREKSEERRRRRPPEHW